LYLAMGLSCIGALFLTTAYVGPATPVCESTYTSKTTVACGDQDPVVLLQSGVSVTGARLTRTVGRSAQSGSFPKSSPLFATRTDSAHRSSAPFVEFGVSLLLIMANSIFLVVLYLVRRKDESHIRLAGCTPANYMPAHQQILMLFFVVFMFACTDQYLASVPDIARDLNSSVASVSATVQTNWVIKGVCSIFIGAISDRTGRRPCMILCSVSLAIATGICAMAPNMPLFMFGRVFQGIGESGVTVCFATTRDCFDDEKLRLELIGLLMLMVALVPILAPAAGGLLASWVGWRWSFVILFNVGLFLIVAVYVFQKETAPSRTGDQARQESVLSGLLHIWTLMKDRYLATLIFGSSVGFASIIMLLDCVNGYVMETQYDKPVEIASLFIGSFGLAIFAGGVLTLMITGIGPLRTIRVFMLLAIIPIATALIVARFSEFSAWLFMIPFYVFAFWGMPFSSCTQVLILHPYKGQSGAVSGLFQSFAQVAGAAVSAIGTQVAVQHQAHGVLCFAAAMILLSAIVFWIGFGLYPPDWAFEVEAASEK